ncbi:MAG: hypothetical protein ACKOPT_12860 [Cyanobium sp.]
MDHPLWLLVPWLVFAIAVGFKVWKFTRLIHYQVRRSPWGMERFRMELERHWQRSGSLR